MTTATKETGLTVALPGTLGEVSIRGEWIASRDEILSRSTAIKEVSDDDGYESAGECLKSVTKSSNALEAMRKDITSPFLDAQKKIKAVADKERSKLESEKKRLKGMMGVHMEAVRKRQAKERARQEAEAQAEIQRQIAEHEAEIEAGLIDDDADLDIVELPTVEIEDEPTSYDTKTVKTVTYEVVDVAAVPREFCVVDKGKLRAYLNANREEIKKTLEQKKTHEFIPGVEFRIEENISAR